MWELGTWSVELDPALVCSPERGKGEGGCQLLPWQASVVWGTLECETSVRDRSIDSRGEKGAVDAGTGSTFAQPSSVRMQDLCKSYILISACHSRLFFVWRAIAPR